MKTTIDGYQFEGTPEEIATYIKLFGKTETADHVYIPVSPTPDYGRSDVTWNYDPICCQNCLNRGKGPCFCTLPYMTQTGWRGNYTIATTTTYTADIPEVYKTAECTTATSKTVGF